MLCLDTIPCYRVNKTKNEMAFHSVNEQKSRIPEQEFKRLMTMCIRNSIAAFMNLRCYFVYFAGT